MTKKRGHRLCASDSDRGRGVEPMPALFYLGQQRFHNLVFLREVASRPLEKIDGRRFIRRGRFACDCGATIIAELRNVRRGLTRSCGCIRKGTSDRR